MEVRTLDRVEILSVNLPLVSVVILNFNGGALLAECVKSVLNTHYPHLHVVVIDNSSKDGSIDEMLRICEGAKNLKIVENSKNTGFCIGNNLGLRYAEGEYVVFLNNDVVVDPDWLTRLVDEAMKCNRGFYEPKILLLDNPRVINTVGNNITLSGICYPEGFGELDRGQYSKMREIAYASGACVLTSREVIEEIGLFDPNYFAFGEDADLGWRGRMFGIRSYCVPSSKIYHKWGYSWGHFPKNKMYWVERNRLITVLKNYSSRTLSLMFPLFLLVEMGILTFALTDGWFSEKVKGYSDVILLRNYIKTQRGFLQRKRTVHDGEVINVFSNVVLHPKFQSSAVLVFNRIVKISSRILRPFVR